MSGASNTRFATVKRATWCPPANRKPWPIVWRICTGTPNCWRSSAPMRWREPARCSVGADYRLHRVKVRYPDHRVHARNALCQGQRPIVDQQRDVRFWSGFLHPVKGLEYLIRAMDRVRQAYPGAQLALVGGWDSLALPGSEGEAYR